jgi:hypothetical protein
MAAIVRDDGPPQNPVFTSGVTDGWCVRDAQWTMGSGCRWAPPPSCSGPTYASGAFATSS